MSADPEHIARYRIEGVLGRGAMGVVYRAHDPEIDRPVAIKLIRADLLDGDDRVDFLARFRREAQAAGRCMHPNIVTIYDFAMHEGNPFLAMEFVDGVSLSQARERGAVFEPADAVFVILQVLEALGAAHAMGIVHRDIKPANILIVGESRVKVTDFGISRFESSEITHIGSVIGTPSYMSPEQCRGDPVDGRSDLFSTGAVLYELLCGERPFAGRNYTEVTQRVLNEPHPDIRERSVAVSPALKAVVDRALAKSRDARFATAAEMAAALRAAMAGDPSATAIGLADRTIVIPKTPLPPSARASGGPIATNPAPTKDLALGTNPALGTTGLTGTFDADVVSTLERQLAQHVGPIARYLVQNAMRNADTVESLCTLLASNIERSNERDAFRVAALQHLRRTPGSATRTGLPAPSAIPEDELERARTELARFIGPVARVLVKRNAGTASSVADLWQKLAVNLESESDRKAFLAGRRR